MGFLLASSRAAAAVPHFVAVTYEIDPTLSSCPNVTEFRAMVAQQLGYDPHRLGSSSGVRIRVRPTENGIEGTVDWSTPTEEHVGERRFESRSEECQKLIATVGFVVAVQLQLMAAEEAPKVGENGVNQASTAPGNSPSESDRARDERSTFAKLTLTAGSFEVRTAASRTAMDRAIIAGVGPSVGFGLAPDPLVLGRIFVAARYGWFGLEAGAERTLTAKSTQSYGGGFEHAWTLGTLAACGWYGPAFACGVAKLGNLHVDGFGVDRPASPDGLVMQLGPRVAYSFALSDYFLLLGRAEALYLLTPWTVDLNHVTVWSAPRLSAVAGIDIAARFR
jgi:hypothetical protein